MTEVSMDAIVAIYRGGGYVRDGRRIRTMELGGLFNNMVLLDGCGNTGIQLLDVLLGKLLNEEDLRAGESVVRLTLSVE